MTDPISVRRNTRTANDFVYWVQLQIGDSFVTGTQVVLSDPDPNIFDGSELVRWSASQVGLFMPIGADNQIDYCARKGTEITLAEGEHLRGALLWATGTMAISLGGGRVISGVDGQVGILKSDVLNLYQRAGKVPGLFF